MTEISDLPKLEKIVEQEIVYIDRPGHLPKDQRKTILFLSDDIRVHSGVAIMANEIVEGTCHYYNWVQIGAAINTPNVGSMIEFSEEMQKRTGVRDASVKIIPYNGYGDSRVLREVLKKEKIDAVLHFTDPRYWIWLYQLEHEIRQYIPLFFYAIWDNIPFPYYNENYYRSCDWIGTISKQTYNIVKNVIRKET